VRVFELWGGVVLISGLAALAGYGLFDGAASSLVAFVLAFARGAILTMLADTMMPEAFAHGGKLVGVFTTLGFATAYAVSALE
jgi:ZIP family zinc transporter